MKPYQLATAFLAILIGHDASAADQAYREPNPHWGTLDNPHIAWDIVSVAAPPGHRLCGMAESYSSLEPAFVLLDPSIRCEDLSMSLDQETLPDFITIEAGPDAAIKYENTADLVKDERFYCNGLSYDKAPLPITKAHTAISHAGKILAGLDTIKCTREDKERGRYSKAYLAFRPVLNQSSEIFKIAAYVHVENKRKADALLDQIVRSLKLVK